MKKITLFLVVVLAVLVTIRGNALALSPVESLVDDHSYHSLGRMSGAIVEGASGKDDVLRTGWVIGYDKNNAVILHTKNGGRKWVVQGKWAGYAGNDISAVDTQTAWAALGSKDSDTNSGMILHTTNGGAKWTKQKLPEGVDAIKGIKGLTRDEAWAVSLTGTILHTTDGGKVWSIVEHTDFPIRQVNRMDAIGYREVRTADRSGRNTGMINANVWIADEHGDDDGHLGMIHTLYDGEIWRQESIPCIISNCQVHMVSAYSLRVVWAAAWGDGSLYRTADGGENWENVGNVGGANDIDDMCAYSADKVWLVQFQSALNGYGIIYNARLEDGGISADQFTPDPNYRYEGLTCADDQTAWVVGYTDSPDLLPKGIILATNDGGQSWVRQRLPVDDAKFWKVSFVGARR